MDNILIIDDEKSLLDLLTVVFKKEGYGVKTALSAAKAFEVLDKDDIDLVISDIKMPGEIDGIGLYEWVLRERPGLGERFLFVWGFGRDPNCRR